MSTPRPPRNDQVFNLSLAELAFVMLLILLMLSAWLLADSASKTGQLDRLATANSMDSGQLLTQLQRTDKAAAHQGSSLNEDLEALRSMRRIGRSSPSEIANKLELAVQRSGTDVDAILTSLVNTESPSAELRRLRLQAKAQDNEINALRPVREALLRHAPRMDLASAAQQMESALRLKSGLEQGKGGILNDADITRLVKFVSQGAAGLRPCWTDAAGRVQNLLEISVSESGFLVLPRWPDSRHDEAEAMPGMAAITATGGAELTPGSFRRHMQPLLEWSKQQAPECRLYASIKVTAQSAAAATRGINTINSFFYTSLLR